MVPVVAFDTLRFSETLVAGGFSVLQAKAVAEAFAEATGQELATKSDVIAIKNDIARLETATKNDIIRLETATKNDIARLEAATKSDTIRLETKIDTVEHRLEVAMKRMELRLIIKMGMMLTGLFTMAGGAAVVAIRIMLH
ncbi:MAG: hypothetical protein FD149_2329 [Rhodospirillaceae bacterium]|nr:MAG: hypothetical protein FD149_2329 [Rhodospirillaceae bacterium]